MIYRSFIYPILFDSVGVNNTSFFLSTPSPVFVIIITYYYLFTIVNNVTTERRRKNLHLKLCKCRERKNRRKTTYRRFENVGEKFSLVKKNIANQKECFIASSFFVFKKDRIYVLCVCLFVCFCVPGRGKNVWNLASRLSHSDTDGDVPFQRQINGIFY